MVLILLYTMLNICSLGMRMANMRGLRLPRVITSDMWSDNSLASNFDNLDPSLFTFSVDFDTCERYSDR